MFERGRDVGVERLGMQALLDEFENAPFGGADSREVSRPLVLSLVLRLARSPQRPTFNVQHPRRRLIGEGIVSRRLLVDERRSYEAFLRVLDEREISDELAKAMYKVESGGQHGADGLTVLRAAADHPGTALVEIYQNCNIFNDGAFEVLKDKQQAEEAVIRLEHGKPIRFGVDQAKGVVRDPATGDLQVVDVTPENEADILVHDAHNASPTTAFALSRLADPDTLHHTPIGVFRSADRPVYDTLMSDQLDEAVERQGQGDLSALLTGNDTWTVAG